MTRALVIGGGIAGLATAHALERAAAGSGRATSITVLEAGSRIGGRIRTTEEDGYRIEWAANAVLGLDGAPSRLLGELGLDREVLIASPAAARRYLARGGRLHRFPLDPVSLLRFSGLSPLGRLRVAAEPLFARRVDHEESIHDYAARHIGEEAAHVLIGTAMRGIFAGDARRLSVDAALPVMRQMEREHRSLVFALIARRRAARRTEGGEGEAGAAGATAGGPGGRALWSLRGGMEALVQALGRAVGSKVRLRARAEALERGDSSGGEPEPWRLRLDSGETLAADLVALAVPPREAAALLERLDPRIAASLRSLPLAGVAVVGLGFHPDAFSTPPDGYGFLVTPGEPLEILGALFESNLFPGRAPPDRILVRAMVGGIDRTDLLERSDEELIETARSAIDRMVGLRGRPERTWIIRQREAIPQYPVGHTAMLRAIDDRLERLPGLGLTGSAYRGIAVGTLLEDAQRTASRLVGSRAMP